MPNCSKHFKTTFNDSLVSEKRAYGILRSLHSHAKWPWHVFTRGVFGNRLPSVLSDEFAISIQDDETWDALDFEGLVQLRQGLLGHISCWCLAFWDVWDVWDVWDGTKHLLLGIEVHCQPWLLIEVFLEGVFIPVSSDEDHFQAFCLQVLSGTVRFCE